MDTTQKTQRSEVKTPYDHPETLLDRILYPSFRRAYTQGVNDLMDTLLKLDWDQQKDATTNV